MKVRVRFGIRLVWPISNVGIFVLRQVPRENFEKLVAAVMEVKAWLTMNGRDDIAQRLVCEES